MADIFISYTSSDRDWAFWIAKELEALGHAPHIHEWEIKGGDDIYAWMAQRHDAADHVLCVVSDDYLKAPYSTLERNAALWQAAAKRPGFVLFVAVKPSRLPSLIDHYRRCELFGVVDEEARKRFRAFMARPADAALIPFPGEAFAVSNVPIRVPTHFLGREDTLAVIATALAPHEGRVAIAALHGLRGVGKTTLAAAYAERHRADFRATWWIRAQTESTMRADLVGLGVRLRWVGPDEKEEPAIAAVMDRLRHESEGILLIYDNAVDVEALRPYLPRGGAARVLITSNARAWRRIAEPIEITLWPKQIGADYLIVRTGRTAERAAAEALAQTLGGLPLAHEQAAAYCEQLDMALADYHQRFDATPAKFLDDARHAPGEYHDGLTVAKTFALAIEKAAKLHAAAEPLIVHAALLAPEPIPLFLFAEGREKLGEPLASALEEDGLIEAIAALRAFALVDRETIADERDPAITTDCVRLHRLVREVTGARRADDAREELRHALIAAVAAIYPHDIDVGPKEWPRARRLDAIALALVDSGAAVPSGAEEIVARLLGELAAYRSRVLADHAGARRLDERALAICEAAFGSEHAETAVCLNNLALALSAGGDLAGARTLHERALAMKEKTLGATHPSTATSLNSLGSLLHAQGDLAAARPLLERALAIREQVLGLEHPDTATSLNNLAMLLRDQGDVAGAGPLYARALEIRERALGAEHPDTAMSLNNLAVNRKTRGDFAEARRLYERALAIQEKVLGPEHTETATTLNNLAATLQAQGELASSQPLYERAAAILERALGADHPAVAVNLGNLAALLHDRGDLMRAQSLYERALGINEKTVGPQHRDTATNLSNLSRLLRDLGRHDEAEPRFRRAIAIGETALGAGHPLTQRFQAHYARQLLMTDRAGDALRVGETALAIHERRNGPKHPWTKDSARVTADALDALGRGDEAKGVRERYGIETKAS